MIKILFVCHGNICRSPMAEFLMRHMVDERRMSDLFFISSCATSSEEVGNAVHYGTRKKLAEYHISTSGKTAVQLDKRDYVKYDYLIGMEQRNITNIHRIVGSDPQKKVGRLLDFTGRPGDIADPWYTGDFDKTYDDIREGCTELLKYVLEQENAKIDEK